MKVGDLVQPYMVQEPYAKFLPGLLVQVEVGIYRFSGRRRMDAKREYRVFYVLSGGYLHKYEEPFWNMRSVTI